MMVVMMMLMTMTRDVEGELLSLCRCLEESILRIHISETPVWLACGS